MKNRSRDGLAAKGLLYASAGESCTLVYLCVYVYVSSLKRFPIGRSLPV